jgi:hypothetical protein
MVSEGLDAIWESSRNNEWSFPLPLVLNIGTVVLVMIAFLPWKWIRWGLNVVVVIVMGYFAIEYSSMEIEEKWRIRSEWIKANQELLSENERSAGTTDGANRVLGPILTGSLAVAFRSVLVLMGLAICRVVLIRIWRAATSRTVSAGSSSMFNSPQSP